MVELPPFIFNGDIEMVEKMCAANKIDIELLRNVNTFALKVYVKSKEDATMVLMMFGGEYYEGRDC
jgi:hypothetical protein